MTVDQAAPPRGMGPGVVGAADIAAKPPQGLGLLPRAAVETFIEYNVEEPCEGCKRPSRCMHRPIPPGPNVRLCHTCWLEHGKKEKGGSQAGAGGGTSGK